MSSGNRFQSNRNSMFQHPPRDQFNSFAEGAGGYYRSPHSNTTGGFSDQEMHPAYTSYDHHVQPPVKYHYQPQSQPYAFHQGFQRPVYPQTVSPLRMSTNHSQVHHEGMESYGRNSQLSEVGTINIGHANDNEVTAVPRMAV